MNKLIKAESLTSLMVVMLIFSVIYLGYSRWQHIQNKQSTLIFQQQQALQIAENQIALLMAGKPCENQIRQNEQEIKEQCRSNTLKITFPSGEVVIEKGK